MSVNNTPIGWPRSCQCSGPQIDRAPTSGRLTHFIDGDHPGSTSACANVACSPIACPDCCEVLDILPPYVPSPDDLVVLPSCHVI